jgi:hypothetical protein
LVECRFISFQFRKSNKKTAAFYCQRFGNLHAGCLSAVKASFYWRLSGLVSKLVVPFIQVIRFTTEVAILLCYRQAVKNILIFSDAPTAYIVTPAPRPGFSQFAEISTTLNFSDSPSPRPATSRTTICIRTAAPPHPHIFAPRCTSAHVSCCPVCNLRLSAHRLPLSPSLPSAYPARRHPAANPHRQLGQQLNQYVVSAENVTASNPFMLQWVWEWLGLEYILDRNHHCCRAWNLSFGVGGWLWSGTPVSTALCFSS